MLKAEGEAYLKSYPACFAIYKKKAHATKVLKLENHVRIKLLMG